MTNENFIRARKDSKESFGDIVLKQIRRILQIGSEIDSQKKYIQSVENLGILLLPYADEEIKEKKTYEEFYKIMNSIEGTETLIEKYKEDYSNYKKIILKDHEDKSEEYNGYIKTYMGELELRYAKYFFSELNLLLQRVEYLKSSVYGDGFDEGAEEDIEDKDE